MKTQALPTREAHARSQFPDEGPEISVLACRLDSNDARGACGTLLSRLHASARKYLRTPMRSRARYSAAKYPLQDERARRERPGRAEAFRATTRGRRNIQSGEILRDCGATRLSTSNPGPAAGGGYPRRPSTPQPRAGRHAWWSTRRA